MNRTLDEFAVLLKHQFHSWEKHLTERSPSSELFGLFTPDKILFYLAFEIFLTLPFPKVFPGSEF